MRIRSIAAVVLVAAGLSITLTGSAGAGEPDHDDAEPVIVTCEHGEVVERAPTDEELEWMPAQPLPPGAIVGRASPAEPLERGIRIHPDGDTVRVLPAPALPPSTCAMRVEPRR